MVISVEETAVATAETPNWNGPATAFGENPAKDGVEPLMYKVKVLDEMLIGRVDPPKLTEIESKLDKDVDGEIRHGQVTAAPDLSVVEVGTNVKTVFLTAPSFAKV